MAELYPTETRLALLRSVKDLTGYQSMGRDGVEIYWDGAGLGRRVTTSVEKMILAGWVKESARHPVEKTFSYRLREAGLKVLEKADHHG